MTVCSLWGDSRRDSNGDAVAEAISPTSKIVQKKKKGAAWCPLPRFFGGTDVHSGSFQLLFLCLRFRLIAARFVCGSLSQ